MMSSPKFHFRKTRVYSQAGPPREDGAAYLMLLLAVMVVGIGLSAVSEVWHTTLMREKEQELLFVGDQFRQAITQYNAQTPAGNAQRFPAALDDLLKDPRVPGTKRYLRKIFTDPITGEKKWGLVRGTSGGITGVFSLSNGQTIKKTNFSLANKNFEGLNSYADWVFMSTATQPSPLPPKKALH